MQTGKLAPHHHEAGARNACRRCKIEPQRLAELHVIARCKCKGRRRAPAAHFNIGCLVGAFGHGRMQQVRQIKLRALKLALYLPELLIRVGKLRGEGIARSDERAHIGALRLHHPHLLRRGIACGTQAVAFNLPVLALLLERLQRRHIEREAAAREILGHRAGVGSQQLRIDHWVPLQRARAAAWRAAAPGLRQS